MKIVEEYNKRIITTLIVGITILLLMFLIVFFSVDIKKKITLPYNDSGSINYNVFLKENDFYEEKSLPKNSKYISALIDYIDTDFNYMFSAQQSINMKYIYYIEGTLVINDKDGKSVYEKKYTLLDKQEKDITGNNFNINEKIKIDYGKYNSLAKNFLMNYNVSDDANLIVRLFVKVTGTHENFDNSLSDNGVLELKIPLKNTLTTIEFDEHAVNNSNTLLKYSSTKIKHPILLFISLIITILDIIYIIYKLVLIINSRDAKTLYNLKLNKIKKEYDRYMSETVITQNIDELLKTRSLRVILVKTFEDLLDIRDSLKSPILFHEEIPNVETVFYIINDNLAYIYLMHVNKFKKKKELFWKKDETSKENDLINYSKKEDNSEIDMPKLKKVHIDDGKNSH